MFAEAYRVLKPGGRLAISDVVALAELPRDIREGMKLCTGCIAGASTVSAVENMLSQTGFTPMCVAPKEESRSFISTWAPGADISAYVLSAAIKGVKPETLP